MSGPDRITTVISDFGGVLTTPLVQSFAAVQDQTGIPMEELGKAMTRIELQDERSTLIDAPRARARRAAASAASAIGSASRL